MEGKYTKAGTIISLLGLLITIVVTVISFIPTTSNNLAGEWLMISKVEKADLKTYIGAEIQWRMFMTECEGKISGTAEKVKINGVNVDYNQRTLMEFEGVIEKNKLFINYVENGKKRKTNGIITVVFENDKFSGDFSQTASSAKGIVKGVKVNK